MAAKLYASKFGNRLKSGRVVYRGRHHQHWTRRCLHPRFRCWCWYCPSVNGWFFWNARRACYLPVVYLPVLQEEMPSIGENDPPEPVPEELEEVPEEQREEIPETEEAEEQTEESLNLPRVD